MPAATGQPHWAAPGTTLDGRTVLVVGGAGGVGEGVVRSLLAAGAAVVVAGRNAERLSELTARIDDPRLTTEVLDALGDDLDDRAGEVAGRYGPLDGVVVSVASFGSQGRKPALDLTDAEFRFLIEANLTSVFRLYRAFVPHIAADGALIQINGMSADMPFPGGAGLALAAAARKSLTLTVAAERAGRGPRVYQLIVGFIRTRPRQQAGIDDPGWIPAADVGVHIAELIAGTSPLAGDDLQYFVDVAQGPRPGPRP